MCVGRVDFYLAYSRFNSNYIFFPFFPPQVQKTESVDNEGEWIVMKTWGWFYVPLGTTFKSYFYQVFVNANFLELN